MDFYRPCGHCTWPYSCARARRCRPRLALQKTCRRLVLRQGIHERKVPRNPWKPGDLWAGPWCLKYGGLCGHPGVLQAQENCKLTQRKAETPPHTRLRRQDKTSSQGADHGIRQEPKGLWWDTRKSVAQKSPATCVCPRVRMGASACWAAKDAILRRPKGDESQR